MKLKTLVSRLVEKDCEIREKVSGFLNFELVLTGKALVETIVTKI